MTLEELYETKPRGEVIITGGELNKTYKAFVCHGCQTCWDVDPDDDEKLVESYPHYLYIEEVPCDTATGSPSVNQPGSSTSTPIESTSSVLRPSPTSDPGTESA